MQPTVQELVTGFVTVFFDTLGIGSFATTTAIFRAWRLVPDELIPGTLNVGHAIESVLSAFVFIEVVPVAASTLIPMVAASAIGAWLGSGVVAGLRRDRIRLGMGVALIVAASMMLDDRSSGSSLPAPTRSGSTGRWLGIAVAGNFVLGALMTLGIGLYAPCMILVSLLGIEPEGRVPDHDGLVRGPDADGRRAVREDRALPSVGVAWD